MRMRRVVAALVLLSWARAANCEPADRARPTSKPAGVMVHVDVGSDLGPFGPVWSCFGHDEPNYTYAPNGKKLLGELAALSPTPVYIRTHNLLTSGAGIAALKWGSTGAYNEDASGKPVYNWTILDRIFDAYHDLKIKPLVEIGFMPEALSVKPEPYRHQWPGGPLFTGWSYPPKDYGKWAELVRQWARHEIDRYGKREVETWLWEVWNEPDIEYWHGSPEEYFKLYDYSADALRGVLPAARIGGPDCTGPGGRHAAEFLRAFLDHCTRGRDFATGKTGSPLDFVSFHPKGSPKLVDGHVRMNMMPQLRSIDAGFEIVASYPQYRDTPVILGEFDPEGCAACSAEHHPENAYRNGPLYACYEAVMLKNTLDLAAVHHANLRGIVTWAFEFEDQPYFAGFRDLATNGVDKPVLNVFRMFGMMTGRRVRVESDGSETARQILSAGVRSAPDVDGLAVAERSAVRVLLWNYHDDDVAATDAQVEVIAEHLPSGVQRVSTILWRIDRDHANAYEIWKQMGAPQFPSTRQYLRLQSAGQLQPAGKPEQKSVIDGAVRVHLSIPREGVALLQLQWS